MFVFVCVCVCVCVCVFQSLRSNYPVQVTDPQGIRGIYCLFTVLVVINM